MARQFGGASPYYTAVDQTLEQYIPLPFQEMAAAGQAIQQRSDTAMEQNVATDALLGSIEALAPEHKNYISKQVNSYRTAQKDLYDKFNGNMADPEYIRQAKQMNVRFAADPTIQTIRSANERYKIQDRIAAEKTAKGELFVRPEFSGIGKNGQLTDEVGNIRGVTTLDDWGETYKAASAAMINNGKGTISNRDNLSRVNKSISEAIKSGSPEVTDLVNAYRQRGMSEDQAKLQVANDVVKMRSQYVERTERDAQYYSYQLAAQSASLNRQKHAAEMNLLNRQIASLGGKSAEIKPTEFVSQRDIVAGRKLSGTKQAMVEEFSKKLDSKGNIAKGNGNGNQVKLHANSVNLSQGFSPTGVLDSRIPDQSSNSKMGNRSANEALKYMRNELGWNARMGSAKQVADAYKQYIKNESISSTYWVAANPTTHGALENAFKQDFLGRQSIVNGSVDEVREDVAVEYEKNARLKGITLTARSGKPSLQYVTHGKDNKPVTVEVPLPEEWSNRVKNSTKLSSLVQNNYDNATLEKMIKKDATLVRDLGDKQLIPRMTKNGVRYAVGNYDYNTGNIVYDRQGGAILYADDSYIDTDLLKESSDLTEIIKINTGKTSN